jgi:hypothetical protein
MRNGMEDLKLNHLWVIYAGKHIYPMDKKITALPIKDISTLMDHISKK